MKHFISFQSEKGQSAGSKVIMPKMPEENKDKGKGLTSLKKGQQIQGLVVSVNDFITLNFDGHEVKASKEVLKDAKPGDVRLFDVIKATDKEIELKVADNTADKKHKAMTVSIKLETDQNTLKEQKHRISRQAEKEKKNQKTKNEIERAAARITTKDYLGMEKEGFAAENLTITGLNAFLDRIKIGSDKETKGLNTDSKTVISDRLKAENLPATAENIQKVTNALEQSTAAQNIDDKTEIYLISQEMEPTIGNIYKAYYSANAQKQDGLDELTEVQWKELQPQAEEVITSAGDEVNEENLEDAKWLIENRLPLTEQTFDYKKELEDIKANTTKDTVLDKIMEGMKFGISPQDISLRSDSGTDYDQLINDINHISEESVTRVVQEGTPVTIKNLTDMQTSNVKHFDSSSDSEEFNNDNTEAELKDSSYEEIKARRQLEEIRLKMTAEAAARLEKQGIHIETDRLEKVVEALRDLEDSYYKKMLSEADVTADADRIRIIKDTVQSIDQLKHMPSAVLGLTLSERKQQAIPDLLAEGSKLRLDLSKAGQAYETLMTVPNKEYGDSIQKAFKNMEPLLKELGIENTALNQRAARILGYNRMDITKGAIDQVKEYDTEVSDLIQNLQPSVAVRMIREGINPLDMPIYELNQTIDRIKEEQGITPEDKFSTYLRKLEKEDGITAEERKSYIGIYRLLYNIEKTDGAAVGAVLNSGREVTLNSLLTAVRTVKKGSVDSIINDEFGSLQSLSQKGENITEQVNAAYSPDRNFNGGSNQDKNALIEEQTKYLDRILKSIREEISPEKINKLQQDILHKAASGGQTAADFTPISSSGKEILNTLGDIPVEKLFDQLQKLQDSQMTDEQVYEGRLQEIRELNKNADQSVRFLNDFKIPCTPANLMMANHILSNGEVPIKKLLKQKNENAVENSENDLKENEDRFDTLIDKSSMKEAYDRLEKEAKASLERACSEEVIDSKRLAELKRIGTQMTFLKTLADKEFYRIPIETENGITNMNLTIIRGLETSGKVSVAVWSKRLGNVKAELSIKDQTLKGFISSDSREGLELLEGNRDELEQAAQEEGIAINQLDFGIKPIGTDSYSYQDTENEDAPVRSDTERKLYRLAKAMIYTVRAAERAGQEVNRAAS